MRDPEGKTVSDIFPTLFDSDDDDEEESGIAPSRDEIEKLRQMMREENKRAGFK